MFFKGGSYPKRNDKPSHQPSYATVSTTQELGSQLLGGPVSSSPALASEKTTMPTSSAPQLSKNDTNRIIKDFFSPAQILRCITSINVEAQAAMEFQKKSWIDQKETSFSARVVIQERDKLLFANRPKTSKTFSSDPSTMLKLNAVTEHMSCAKHQTTVKNELLNRVSHFQKQVDEKESTKVLVLQEAFHAMSWLAKESIPNRKITYLLKPMELLGLEELKYLLIDLVDHSEKYF